MSKIDCNNHCNKELKSEFVWLKLKIFQSFYFTTRAQGFSSYSSSNTLINYGIIISYIEALKSCTLLSFKAEQDWYIKKTTQV